MNHNKLQEAFDTLLYSWRSDTPPEAIWAANLFMQALLDTDNLPVILKEDFDEEDESNSENFLDQLSNIHQITKE